MTWHRLEINNKHLDEITEWLKENARSRYKIIPMQHDGKKFESYTYSYLFSSYYLVMFKSSRDTALFKLWHHDKFYTDLNRLNDTLNGIIGRLIAAEIIGPSKP